MPLVPRGWDIGPTIPMGPSPWPSWIAPFHGQFHEGRPLYIHTYIHAEKAYKHKNIKKQYLQKSTTSSDLRDDFLLGVFCEPQYSRVGKVDFNLETSRPIFMRSSRYVPICYRLKAKQLKNEGNTTGCLKTIWTGSS